MAGHGRIESGYFVGGTRKGLIAPDFRSIKVKFDEFVQKCNQQGGSQIEKQANEEWKKFKKK